MPKSKNQKRLEAAIREFDYWGKNYLNMPMNIKMLMHGIYCNLDLEGKAKLADHVDLKYGTGFLLFIK